MRLEVHAERPYPCYIGSSILGQLATHLDGVKTAAIICSHLLEDRADEMAQALSDFDVDVLVIVVPDGEHAKNPQILTSCWEQLGAANLTRSDAIIGLGGGATTDLAGFVASTWLRGIRYISVPTTVLAMVDAAVGGKTGIDLNCGKNLVGAFWEPAAVLIDMIHLRTLPEREIRSGFAEIIKAGFVDQPQILDLIQDDLADAMNPASDRFAELVRLAVEFKARVVSSDLRESTSSGTHLGREILNYGHTFGHAVEASEHYQMRHGEAVSIGMVYAASLAHQTLGLDQDVVQLHRHMLTELGLPTGYDATSWDQLRELMGRDKKTRGRTLRFVGLTDLYSPQIIEAPAEEILEQVYRSLGA